MEGIIDEMLEGALRPLLEEIRQLKEIALTTQADVDALTAEIASLNDGRKTWEDQVVTILTNVEAALVAEQTKPGVDLSGALAAVQAGKTQLSALPVETDPTAPPAPTAPVVDPNAPPAPAI